MKIKIVHSSQDKTSAGVMLRLNSPRRNASCVVVMLIVKMMYVVVM